MTASTIQPKDSCKARSIWGFTRRLGLQALMSVTVMTGLQIASINGYDVRDLLPARAPEAAGPVLPEAEPVRVVGVPVRFDLPVQAGSALDRILPKPPADESTAVAEKAGPPMPAKASSAAAPAPAPAPLMAALPSVERVATPTPRPHLVAARPAAVPPRPSEVPFDVSPRGVEVYGVAELVGAEAPPEPMQMADAGFRVGDLVPSGEAILMRTAAVTGSAAQVVTGTATRIFDLVR